MRKHLPEILAALGTLVLISAFGWLFNQQPACDTCVARAARLDAEQTARFEAKFREREGLALTLLSIMPALKPSVGIQLD